MIEAIIDELVLALALIDREGIEVSEIAVTLPGGDLVVVK